MVLEIESTNTVSFVNNICKSSGVGLFTCMSMCIMVFYFFMILLAPILYLELLANSFSHYVHLTNPKHNAVQGLINAIDPMSAI